MECSFLLHILIAIEGLAAIGISYLLWSRRTGND